MTGSTPSRKHLFRRQGTPEAREDRGAPVEGADAPSESSALPAEQAERPDQAPGTPADPARTRGGPRAGRGRGAALASAAGRGMSAGGRGARRGLTVVADRIIDVAPRIPVRDLATLRAQFPGLGPEQIADRLVAGAIRSSGTVGAGVGAAAMLPTPPTMPAELAAEIVGVASVEFKLIAELHEVYGVRAPGGPSGRASAYLSAWTEERGIDVTKPTSFNGALGGQMRRQLRQQILKRTVRNFPTLIPFMVGAAAGALMNRRETRKLAEKVRKDLRRRQVPWDSLPAAPEPELGSPKELQQRPGPLPGDGPSRDGG
ncbi:hypothetical protein [Streptomyces sp. NPDC048845]|uniref:hypothetical protein n=1 Tax=Streptomyces sp. NPDC048845 TaxID=3155390 RepID=UPI0034435FA0